MSQRSIPAMLMRSGTSKGPFFLASDLPDDRAAMAEVLLGVMGSPDVRQIDGLGGARTVTSKVAIVSQSAEPGIDLDYLFAQVEIARAAVDWAPTCGNMLAGVVPFALERGLIAASEDQTTAAVRSVNTGAVADVTVHTPDGRLTFAGNIEIAGVPGRGAPVEMMIRSIAGSKTGALLPTGNITDRFDGVPVTCIDAAVPLVIAPAESLGLSADESPDEIDRNTAFMRRMESVRRQAGAAMGLGDVAESVVPRFAVVAAPGGTGHVRSRYMTPWQTHAAYAVSGAIAAAASALVEGSVTAAVVRNDDRMPETVEIEHPSGSMLVQIDADVTTQPPTIHAGGTIRTVRPLLDGVVFVAG